MNLLDAIAAALAALSLALALWQWLAARQFPLHRRIADPRFAPAVSILKPLKDCDETTAESLESWLHQDYSGPIQVLFGVAATDDPVVPVVKELLRKHPHCDVELVVCPEALGANGKVSTLVQLEKLVKHDLVLVSDGDVRVPPDFLANVVAPLREPPVGLVHCFYRLANPTTAAMRWEAVAINADFWSMVLQAASLKPPDFALGAVMLLRRDALAQIGGFRALADCVADDFHLGRRISRSGRRLAFCPVVVECWHAPMRWRDVWGHQLRWARTIRVCQPLPYFFSILSNATLWPLLWLCLSFTAAASLWAAPSAMVLMLVRIAVAQNLQRRFTPERELISPFWFVPLKDLLQVAVWLGAFAGSTVVWRGQTMKLRRDGALEI
ncbi:MAG: bacteriohopanetetrol glucosamine biosynthesis glycosyltransferase HpnI [Verrucomicrobiota bacterium]|nr:bacteriohopanetetrol glucosamine biosynthesis glycosyltransferase HpnI [Verrucomicrobiota bacterium]